MACWTSPREADPSSARSAVSRAARYVPPTSCGPGTDRRAGSSPPATGAAPRRATRRGSGVGESWWAVVGPDGTCDVAQLDERQSRFLDPPADVALSFGDAHLDQSSRHAIRIPACPARETAFAGRPAMGTHFPCRRTTTRQGRELGGSGRPSPPRPGSPVCTYGSRRPGTRGGDLVSWLVLLLIVLLVLALFGGVGYYRR